MDFICTRFYNHHKGGDKLNVSRKSLILYLGYFLILLISKFLLSNTLRIQIFFISVVIHLVISFYVVYSFFEIYILHEKQGSKLSLSKGKLTSNDWS